MVEELERPDRCISFCTQKSDLYHDIATTLIEWEILERS